MKSFFSGKSRSIEPLNRILFVSILVVGLVFSTNAQKLDSTFGDEGTGFQKISFDLNHDAKKLKKCPLDNGLYIMADIGHFDSTGFDQDWGIIKTDATGKLDTTFGDSGKYVADFRNIDYCFARDIEVLDDGSILVLGTGTANGSSKRPTCIVKLTAKGMPDSTFGTNGELELYIEGYQDYPNDLLVDQSGRIWVVGGADDSTGLVSSAYVLRLDSNGNLDANWGINGVFRKNALRATPSPSRHSTGQEFYGAILDDSETYLYAVGSNTVYQGVITRFSMTGIDSTFGDSGTAAFQHPLNAAMFFRSVQWFNNELVMEIFLYGNNSRDFEFSSFNLADETYSHHRVVNVDDDVFGNFIVKDSTLYISGRNIFDFNIHPAYYADQFMLSGIQTDYNMRQDFGDEGNFFIEYSGPNTKQAGGTNGCLMNDSTIMMLGNRIDSSSFSHILLAKIIIPYTSGNSTTDTTTSVNADELSNFTIFPNPGNGIFHIQLSNSFSETIIIRDIYGRIVHRQLVKNREVLNLHTLSPGTYFASFQGNKSQVQKILKY